MLTDGEMLDRIKSSIVSGVSSLFEVKNLKITILGYAADLKV